MQREELVLLVENFMTAPVLHVPAEESLRGAARMMAERRIGSLVVVDEGRPVGILTERDVVRVVAGGTDLDEPVGGLMTVDLLTTRPEVHIEDVLRTMQERRIRRLVVVDEAGQLAGVITQTDIAKATQKLLGRMAEEQADRIKTVKEIANALNHEMNQPLTGVLGHADMMLMNVPEDSELAQSLIVIRSQAMRMGDLIARLREISDYRTTVYREQVMMLDIDGSLGGD